MTSPQWLKHLRGAIVALLGRRGVVGRGSGRRPGAVRDDLVAQPDGDAFAYVLDTAGVRNVVIARAPDFRPVRVTKFTADDGLEIGDIDWKKDGTAIVFILMATDI